MSDSYVMYRSFSKALKALPKDDRLAVREAVDEYALDEIEPVGLGEIPQGFFELMRPLIDANRKRQESGQRGGRPKPSKTIGLSDEKPKVFDEKTIGLSDEKPKVFDEKTIGLSDEKPNEDEDEDEDVNANENEKLAEPKVFFGGYAQPFEKPRPDMKTAYTDENFRLIVDSWNSAPINGFQGLPECKQTSILDFRHDWQRDSVTTAFSEFSVDEILQSIDRYYALLIEIHEKHRQRSTLFRTYKDLFSFLKNAVGQYQLPLR